ncbi:MAG: preprotein translocase subunit SecG [Treponema sp.]|jgi:preprotein translocase subunit SecG|nr:preprotein translocase subunit SecG [Treponema sp.]
MGILNVLLLVFFIIVAVLLVLLVLIQNEEGDSLGGIFAGGSGSAFGSRSGNVLTRTTTILGALFLALCLSLALINRTPGTAGVEAAGRQLDGGARSDWWKESEAAGVNEAAPEIMFDGSGTAAPVPEASQEDVPAGE